MSKRPLYISYAGPSLLETPLLNKGAAFTAAERHTFNLSGLLPPRYESIEEQVRRAYRQYSSFDEPINKHIYLRAIQDNNETLFYRLLGDHLEEMLPIVYTPTVGDACEHFSDIYRSARGIFVSYSERAFLPDILRNVTKDKVKVLVVTDGERVLGLGDQGIGGMGISIGKLSLYTSCGGISPAYTLPVVLDVGTNNTKLQDDPMYMGARHARVSGDEYYDFVDQFVDAACERWPGVLIQFEDFAQPNAMPVLERNRDRSCCFNDDIQGTAAVTLGTLLSACNRGGTSLSERRVVIAGAGSAGCGIAEMIIASMNEQGLSDAEARGQLYMVDRFGLLTEGMEGMEGLAAFQQRLCQPASAVQAWPSPGPSGSFSLADVVRNTGASVLIGVSGQRGLFDRPLIEAMAGNCERPVILPLSNPSRHAEATPAEVLEWTGGKAIVATGSPFGPVSIEGRHYAISQCNNSYIFPGIGLGVVASKASRISDRMLMAAAMTLAETAGEPGHGDESTVSGGAVLPPLSRLANISKRIAFEVARTAQEDGLAAECTARELEQAIERNFWLPQYREYRRIAARAR